MDKREVKEASLLVTVAMGVGVIVGSGVGFFGTTQSMIDHYIFIGKSQVTWRIDSIQLETCARMLTEGTLTHESQKSACAYFMEKAAGLKTDG